VTLLFLGANSPGQLWLSGVAGCGKLGFKLRHQRFETVDRVAWKPSELAKGNSL